MSSGLYRLEAFGLTAPWVLWRIAHGGLDEPELEDTRTRRALALDDFGPGGIEIALRWFDLADLLDEDGHERLRRIYR